MTLPHRLQPLLLRALPLLVAAALPLAAVLAFSIQPLLGKQLLPIYSGSAGVWPACIVYFQLALLLGYLWAAWLARRSSTVQTLATAGLGAVALLSFHLPVSRGFAEISTFGVIGRLALTTLPALVLLFSASPLLHGWARRAGQEVPYYIHAAANLGALAALWLYPLAVEPKLRSSEQAFLWHGLLVIVAALLVAAAYILRETTQDRAPAPVPAASSPSRGTASASSAPVRSHPFLAALACVAMLGATDHFVAELGSTPLAWVGPLGLYLLSFMVVFSGRWQRWMTFACIAWLFASLLGFMAAKGLTAATVNGARAWLTLSLATSAACLANALAFETRPRERLDRFFIILAAGGFLGAFVYAAVCPLIFPQRLELPLAAAGVLAFALAQLLQLRRPAFRLATAAAILVPLVAFALHQSSKEALGGKLIHLRDRHGAFMLKFDDHSVVLSRDGTTHATQITVDAAAHRRPTLYYSESSAVGRTIAKLREKHPQLRVGILGLNGGTLAAHARAGDTFTFWDVAKSMHRAARENFSYVGDSAGRIQLSDGDGRFALSTSREDFDLIVVDAFSSSGDSLPAYLLTREAIKIYLDRLAARGGLLLVNVAARYTGFFPMIEATAHSFGRAAIQVSTLIAKPADTIDWDPARSEFALVALPERIPEIRAWFPLDEDGGRVKREITAIEGNYIRPQLIWTDDRHAAIDIVDLGRLLSP